MKHHIRTTLEFAAARMSEPLTWQGIDFLVALTGAKVGVGLD